MKCKRRQVSPSVELVTDVRHYWVSEHSSIQGVGKTRVIPNERVCTADQVGNARRYHAALVGMVIGIGKIIW